MFDTRAVYFVPSEWGPSGTHCGYTSENAGERCHWQQQGLCRVLWVFQELCQFCECLCVFIDLSCAYTYSSYSWVNNYTYWQYRLTPYRALLLLDIMLIIVSIKIHNYTYNKTIEIVVYQYSSHVCVFIAPGLSPLVEQKHICAHGDIPAWTCSERNWLQTGGWIVVWS